jgi:formamidopyrimidine-DNA glycosylase
METRREEMPELPEVEAAKRSLEKTVLDKVVARSEVLRPVAVRTHTPKEFSRILEGRKISGVDRRGKALLIGFDREWTLVFHFKLWGWVRYHPSTPKADSATTAMVYFRDGSGMEFRELQLSTLDLVRSAELGQVDFLAEMGLEPLSNELTLSRFRSLVRGRGNIKNVLSDQTRIAGIGNLWAHEILHAAGILPQRKADSLSEAEVEKLYKAMREVLKKAVDLGGEPEFQDALGNFGRYPLAVYNRENQPCPRCGRKIVHTRLGGRPSYYCPNCQH